MPGESIYDQARRVVAAQLGRVNVMCAAYVLDEMAGELLDALLAARDGEYPLLPRLLQERGMLEQVGWGAESAIPKWSGNQHLFGWWYGEAREKDHYVDYDPTRPIVPLFRVIDPAGS